MMLTVEGISLNYSSSPIRSTSTITISIVLLSDHVCCEAAHRQGRTQQGGQNTKDAMI